MCMCVNLYKYHNKSTPLQCLLSSVGSGRWALVHWLGLVSAVNFSGDRGGGAWVLVVGGCNGDEGTFFRRSLATAQHLCSTLVSLVDPGLVGISLKERKTLGVTRLAADDYQISCFNSRVYWKYS